jgi:hypothetical protein
MFIMISACAISCKISCLSKQNLNRTQVFEEMLKREQKRKKNYLLFIESNGDMVNEKEPWSESKTPPVRAAAAISTRSATNK